LAFGRRGTPLHAGILGPEAQLCHGGRPSKLACGNRLPVQQQQGEPALSNHRVRCLSSAPPTAGLFCWVVWHRAFPIYNNREPNRAASAATRFDVDQSFRLGARAGAPGPRLPPQAYRRVVRCRTRDWKSRTYDNRGAAGSRNADEDHASRALSPSASSEAKASLAGALPLRFFSPRRGNRAARVGTFPARSALRGSGWGAPSPVP
jgi:hypothetical protein